MRQSKQTEDDKFELKKIRDYLHKNCKKAYMDYFYMEDFNFFENRFINSLSKAYNIPKKDMYFFSKGHDKLDYLCELNLLIKLPYKTKTYVVGPYNRHSGIRFELPLYEPAKRFDSFCASYKHCKTDWADLIADYPKVYDILWDIFEDYIINGKDEQVSLIEKLILKNKKELEFLENKEAIEARKKELKQENSYNLDKIQAIEDGTFEMD